MEAPPSTGVGWRCSTSSIAFGSLVATASVAGCELQEYPHGVSWLGQAPVHVNWLPATTAPLWRISMPFSPVGSSGELAHALSPRLSTQRLDAANSAGMVLGFCMT